MRILSSTLRAALAALVLLATAPAMAATFDETGGDFGGAVPALDAGPTLALALGGNTVSGQLASQLDRDSFSVTVPTGAVLTSFAFSLTSNASGIVGMTFGLSGPGVALSETFNAGTTDPAFGAAATPLGAGTYALSNTDLLLNAAFSDAADWSFDITVAAVPLPATAPLLIGALGLAGIAARRRKRG